MNILHPSHSYRDQGRREVRSEASRSRLHLPLALLNDFHVVNEAHNRVTHSLYTVHLVGNYKLSTFKVFRYDSV